MDNEIVNAIIQLVTATTKEVISDQNINSFSKELEELCRENTVLKQQLKSLNKKLEIYEYNEIMENKDNHGEFYVYGFFNLQWNEWFYIGKGTKNRINDNNRNRHVSAILTNYPCERKIIKDNLSEKEAAKLEAYLKNKFKSEGSPIIDYENLHCNEAQRAGIERAKKEGKYKGRKPIEIKDKEFELQYERYLNREINKIQFAKILNISRPTLDKIISEKDLKTKMKP